MFQLLYCSNVCTTENSPTQNRRAEQELNADKGGEETVDVLPLLTSQAEMAQYLQPETSPDYKVPMFSPEELVGMTFLKKQEDGTVIRAHVERQLRDTDAENHKNIKFVLNLGNEELDELIAYNKLSDLIEKQNCEDAENPDQLYYAFKEILDHEGPLKPTDKKIKEAKYNLYYIGMMALKLGNHSTRKNH